jgi:hypothetical protein
MIRPLLSLTPIQSLTYEVLRPGEWTLVSEVGARAGRAHRDASYALKRLLGVGAIEVQIVGSELNPIHGELVKRGAPIPRCLGFAVYRRPPCDGSECGHPCRKCGASYTGQHAVIDCAEEFGGAFRCACGWQK